MRVKLILPNLALLLMAGFVIWFLFLSEMTNRNEESLRSRMKTAAMIFTRFERLRSYELQTEAEHAASSEEIVRAFEMSAEMPTEEGAPMNAAAPAYKRRFHRCALGISRYLKKKHYIRPDLVVLTDSEGVAIARNVTPGACPAGYRLTDGMVVVARALQGSAAYSIWSVDDSPFSGQSPFHRQCQMMSQGLVELVAAPVFANEKVVGTIVLGFEISNGSTEQQARLLQADIAIVRGDRVFSSSLKTETERSSLKQQLTLPSVSARIDRASALGKRSDSFNIDINGERYSATALPISNMGGRQGAAALLIGSAGGGDFMRHALIGLVIFLTAIIAAIAALGIILGNHFLKPVMEMEEGILRVINGDSAFRFDIKSSELGGLGYRINQMIDVLSQDEEDS
jgi:hypothetical protein